MAGMANDPGPYAWFQIRVESDFYLCLGAMEAAMDPERYEWDFDDFDYEMEVGR